MKILICQVITPDILDYSVYSIPINVEYAVKMNYDFLTYTSRKDEINYHPAWLKLTCFNDINVDKYDWIWILDADAIINNMDIRLEDIIGNCQEKIIISKNDTNGGRYLNSGSILIRKEFVKNIIDKYNECVENNSPFLNQKFWDQELINDWYEESPDLFSVREMSELNSHWRLYKLEESECLKYGADYIEPYNQTKNLIHHFMSLPHHIRVDWMKKTWITKQFEKLKKITGKNE